MVAKNKTVSLLVYGKLAMFCDPVTKTSGERYSYPVPTYEALRGVLASCYWKPTFNWVIDRVRVLNPIKRDTQGMRWVRYESKTNDRAYNVYLSNVAYQVEAHFEWTGEFPEDENFRKHYESAVRHIKRGGKFDVYLGSRECQAYVEPCEFGEGESAYDSVPLTDFGIMVHGYNYPEQTKRRVLESRLFHCEMVHGIINFPHPKACPYVRHIKDMEPYQFTHRGEDTEPVVEEPVDFSNIVVKPFCLLGHKEQEPEKDMTSWENKLIKTYDKLVGYNSTLPASDATNDLYPGRVMKNMFFELAIDADGNLIREGCRVLPKEDQRTAIPCSLLSQYRTSGSKPTHMLFDRLGNMASDAEEYGDTKSSHDFYIAQTKDWCESEFSHPIAKIIFNFVRKTPLCKTLEELKLMPVTSIPGGGKMTLRKKDWMTSHPDGDLPAFYEAGGDRPIDAYIRIKVRMDDGQEYQIWDEASLYEAVFEYNKKNGADFLNKNGFEVNKGICYITGEQDATITQLHSYVGGSNKLISSNQTDGFLFRYQNKTEASDLFAISYEASQKLHLALRWLWDNQRFYCAGHHFLIWSENHLALPNLISRQEEVIDFTDPAAAEEDAPTGFPDRKPMAYKDRIRAFAMGVNEPIDGIDDDTTYIMELAEPSNGRISILRVDSLPTSDYLTHINHWAASVYDELSQMVEGEVNKKGRQKYVRFIRAATPWEIAKAACSDGKNGSAMDRMLLQLQNCVLTGAPIPFGVKKAILYNAMSDLLKMKAKEREDNRHFVQRIPYHLACAIVRKELNDEANSGVPLNEYKEVWTMALDTNNQDRGYLLGRLLAYEMEIERYALWYQKSKTGGDTRLVRQTNVEKLFPQFQRNPERVLSIIGKRLVPYEVRCEETSRGRALLAERNALSSNIDPALLYSEEALSDSYLLGFRAQADEFIRAAIKRGAEKKAAAAAQKS